MAMKHPSLKYVGDRKIRGLLQRYACPIPFHAVRTRFLGTIATTRTDISPIQALKDLWGGEWPEFDDMDAFNALLQDLTSLWNDLAGGQSRTKPFRLARLSVKPDPDDLQRLFRTRVEEIEGFVEGLFGDEESVDVPESASEALDHLAEINASMHGCLDLMQQVPAPTGSEETLAVTVKLLKELSRTAEKELQTVVLSCNRARRLGLSTFAMGKPTIH